MLVLSRKVGEQTIIAEDIRVVVLAIEGNRVKLGFEGPRRVGIHRAEVYTRILQETEASVSTE
jgi:carbon storage regulator